MSERLIPPRKKNWTKGTPQIGVFLRTAEGGTLEMVNDKADPDEVNLIAALIYGTKKMPDELKAAVKKFVDEYKPHEEKRRAMKPWTEKKQIASALKNEDLRIGERPSAVGPLRGVYAQRDFASGEFVGSFHGRVISRAELFALHGSDKPLFDRVNDYAIGTPSGGHLYPTDLDALGAHLINHSCRPNARWSGMERGAMLVRATHPIAAGEELSIHYGWIGIRAALEKRWHPCACGAPYCAGTIELKIEFRQIDANHGGPNLPHEEAYNRLLADIANDTSEHEETLYGYARNSLAMLGNAKIIESLDMDAFFEKLSGAAREAVVAAVSLRTPPSERRLRKIAERYGARNP